MATKQQEDYKVIVQRCLVIVLKERKFKSEESKLDSKENSPGDKKGKDAKTESPPKSVKPGLELFKEFVAQNKNCFWNPHLEESVTNLKYVGFLHPCSILVGGRDIYVDTVRSAWSRKALQPPLNYSLQKVGEINELEMAVIPQAQFTPLPEALCLIIDDLTKEEGGLANFDSIQDRLKYVYRGIHQPSEQIVYEALDSLMKERKIYHISGKGYYIVTPEMFHTLNGCVSFQNNHLVIGGDNPHAKGGPTIFIPLMHQKAPTADTCSVSCQTETKLNNMEKDEKSKKKLERSNSMKESKKSKEQRKADMFARSMSVRYTDDQGKAIIRDINLKTSDAHQDKDKGDKQTLLGKLFGRNKKGNKSLNSSEEKPDIEYATFSAQFPPPEWQWYESQIEPARPKSPAECNVPRSSTWHYMNRPLMHDAECQSDIFDDEDEYNDCPVHAKAKTMPEKVPFPYDYKPQRQKSSSSHSQDDIVGSPKKTSPPDIRASTRSKKHRKHSKGSRDPHRDSMHHAKSTDPFNLHAPRVEEPVENEYVEYNGAVSPTTKPKMTDEHLYENVDKFRKLNGTMLDSVVSNDYAEIGEIGHLNPMNASNLMINALDVKNNPPTRHKSRVYRKYREMQCATTCQNGNDISVAYTKSAPEKDIAMAKSRDNGVNCIGLNDFKSNNGGPQQVQVVPPLNNEVKLTKGPDSHNHHQHNNTELRQDSKGNTTEPIVNQKGVSNNSLVTPKRHHVVQAQVHTIPEHNPEDSGFSSPRFNNIFTSPKFCSPKDDNSLSMTVNIQSNYKHNELNNDEFKRKIHIDTNSNGHQLEIEHISNRGPITSKFPSYHKMVDNLNNGEAKENITPPPRPPSRGGIIDENDKNVIQGSQRNSISLPPMFQPHQQSSPRPPHRDYSPSVRPRSVSPSKINQQPSPIFALQETDLDAHQNDGFNLDKSKSHKPSKDKMKKFSVSTKESQSYRNGCPVREYSQVKQELEQANILHRPSSAREYRPSSVKDYSNNHVHSRVTSPHRMYKYDVNENSHVASHNNFDVVEHV